ncbi:hypothetical protein [uncultured Treponema sp.]|nr:hypothetical protein [uncultured Treponema sp.]
MNFFIDLRADLFLRDCSVPKYEMKKQIEQVLVHDILEKRF